MSEGRWRGALVAVPGLLFTGLLWLVPRVDASRDARATVLIGGLVLTITASLLIARWAVRRSR